VSPFLKPSHDPSRGWSKPPDLWLLTISLRTLGFDFDALLLIMSQRQLTEQPARDCRRPTSEGQFPFPLAPEFWGSWNDSWLETSLSACGANIKRGSPSFEPL
jgi:hypothetical protein